MKSYQDQRASILIDAETLEIQSRNIYGGKINYEKLLAEAGSGQLIRVQYFKPRDKLTRGWVQLLNDWGYEVKETPKNSDTWLTISAVLLAEKCDVIRLVVGDADYIPLIWFLQSRGVRTEVWMWPECASRELRDLADVFVPITPDFLLDKPDNLLTLTAQGR